jgi:hypothetical protein
MVCGKESFTAVVKELVDVLVLVLVLILANVHRVVVHVGSVSQVVFANLLVGVNATKVV